MPHITFFLLDGKEYKCVRVPSDDGIYMPEIGDDFNEADEGAS